VAQDSHSVLPSYASVSTTGTPFTWAAGTSDARALLKPEDSSNPNDRIAAHWYGSTFDTNLSFSDGQTHRVSLYVVDFDRQNRAETVQVLSAANPNVVLATMSASNFAGGQYLSFAVTGNVIFRITRTQGGSAVLSGVFIDPQ
jgi:hypothetical protein